MPADGVPAGPKTAAGLHGPVFLFEFSTSRNESDRAQEILHCLDVSIPAADKAPNRAPLERIGFGKPPIALWAFHRYRKAFAFIDG